MKRWTVLLTETIHAVGTDALARVATWRIAPDNDEATLRREIADVDGLIVRAAGFIGASLMDAAPRLRVIGRHGVGVDNVDVEAATERGIWVVNTPEANAEAVAEHVFGVMLAFARRLIVADRAVREGDWSLRNRNYGFEVFGRTLGIVGMGRIGARVATIGVRAFSQRVLYADIVARPDLERDLGIERVPLERLLSESDIVTVHTPATPETTGLFNRERLARMKEDALFINASRGTVVVERDLIEALEAGRLGGAALDVFEQEPLPTDSPLLRFPNVILSPHKAGQSDASMKRMALVAEDIVRVLQGEMPKYPVNRPANPRTDIS